MSFIRLKLALLLLLLCSPVISWGSTLSHELTRSVCARIFNIAIKSFDPFSGHEKTVLISPSLNQPDYKDKSVIFSEVLTAIRQPQQSSAHPAVLPAVTRFIEESSGPLATYLSIELGIQTADKDSDSSQNSLRILPNIEEQTVTTFQANGLSLNRAAEILGSQDPRAIAGLTWAILDRFPKSLRLTQSLKDAFNTVYEMVLRHASKSYGEGSVVPQNDSLIHYIRNELERDPLLMRDSLIFYMRLRQLGKPTKVGRYQVGEASDKDIWKIAMGISNGDASRAIRMLIVMGHDEIGHQVPGIKDSPNNEYVKFLNVFSPFSTSPLFAPGTLPNSEIPQRFIERFDLIRERIHALQVTDENIKSNLLKKLRAGHYHFIAGAFEAEEMVRANVTTIAGIKAPVFIAELLGYFYKVVALKTYLHSDGQRLISLGYPRRNITKPLEWDAMRFEIAKIEVDIELALMDLTQYQHRKGAEWAYGMLTGSKNRSRP